VSNAPHATCRNQENKGEKRDGKRGYEKESEQQNGTHNGHRVHRPRTPTEQMEHWMTETWHLGHTAPSTGVPHRRHLACTPEEEHVSRRHHRSRAQRPHTCTQRPAWWSESLPPLCANLSSSARVYCRPHSASMLPYSRQYLRTDTRGTNSVTPQRHTTAQRACAPSMQAAHALPHVSLVFHFRVKEFERRWRGATTVGRRPLHR
jgi:hypothetical protein